MDCKRAEELISAHVEGDMPPGLGLHLDECRACRAVNDEVRGIVGGLRGDHVPEPPDGFWSAMRSGIRGSIGGTDSGLASVIKDAFSGYLSLGAHYWQRALVPAVLVIAIVSGYMFLLPDPPLPVPVEKPLIQALADEGVDIFMEVDEEDAVIAMTLLESGELPDGIYSELYGLDQDELENLSDSLGQMMESM